MDNDILVDADTPQAQKRQATLKEMARRAQDRILVSNPTDEDYTVRFDSIGFVIPSRSKDNGHGLGRAVVFRYVADNYLTQMVDLILTTKMDAAVRVENARRADLGMQPMTKFVGGEELQFVTTLRTDNHEARRALIPVIWLGLAERYGSEAKEESVLGRPKDDRPLDARLLDEIEKGPKMPQKRAEGPTDEELVATADQLNNLPVDEDAIRNTFNRNQLADKDVFTLRKIAREKGIEMDKTAKKNDLIEAISK